MNKFLILFTFLVFSNTHISIAASDCSDSAISKDSTPGALARDGGQGGFKESVELFIVNTFEMYLQNSDIENCPNMKITYKCTDVPLCTAYCIADTATAGGTLVNAVYEVNYCKEEQSMSIRFINN